MRPAPKEKRGRRITGPNFICVAFISWGEDVQLSNPEQNAAVTEAAAPFPHLLPAISCYECPLLGVKRTSSGRYELAHRAAGAPGLTWGDEDRVVLHTAPSPKDALLHL